MFVFFITEMSLNVERYLPYLEVLKTAKPKFRKALISTADPRFIDVVSEISYNYLKGNINCSKEQFSKLSKHRNCLRKLVRLSKKKKKTKKSNKNNTDQRKFLLQKGDGFWFALLTPVVTELTRYFISKALTSDQKKNKNETR